MGSVGYMARQTRPSGTYWPVDDDWKERVRIDIAQQGISQAEMARQLQCSPSAITVLFRKETRESRLVPGVHRILGWPPPQLSIAPDEALRRINSRWPKLSKAQRELVESLVEQLMLQKL